MIPKKDFILFIIANWVDFKNDWIYKRKLVQIS